MNANEARFWSKVDRRGPDECWWWLAGVHRYGQFWFNGRSRGAHQFAYQIAHGPIPAGLFVCHTCDNRTCVNPAHLFAGTAADNSADMVAKGRVLRGERASVAKLTAEDVREIRALHEQGLTSRELGLMFGVHHTTISDAARGDTWGHVR